MSDRFTGRDGGVAFDLELERADLLPGRSAACVLRVRPEDDVEARGILASLIATEWWQYTATESGPNGTTRTTTETRRQEHVRLPVQLVGPVRLAGGAEVVYPFDVPVPPLGPASFESEVLGLRWELEVKIDRPGFDAGLSIDVRVHQPTALLMAGVVSGGQFALWPSAEASEGSLRATIALDPVPVCLGGPLSGELTLSGTQPERLQEIRLELRVKAKATVSSGKDQDLTIWRGRIAGEGEHGAGTYRFADVLPNVPNPTIRLPHGEAHAQLHVILARAWAPDRHLVRDVAVATTTEL